MVTFLTADSQPEVILRSGTKLASMTGSSTKLEFALCKESPEPYDSIINFTDNSL